MEHRACIDCGKIETYYRSESYPVRCFDCQHKDNMRIIRNAKRRERHAALTSLGLKRVKGALGGVYYE